MKKITVFMMIVLLALTGKAQKFFDAGLKSRAQQLKNLD